jgi:hypothetical protein
MPPLPPIPLDLATRLADVVAAGWKAREDRIVAVTLLREELVQNDFALRRVLLQGVKGEALSRDRYDRLSTVLQHRSVRSYSTRTTELYERISAGVQREVAGEVGGTDVERRLNQLAVATGSACEDLDRYLAHERAAVGVWDGRGGDNPGSDQAVIDELVDLADRQAAAAAWQAFVWAYGQRDSSGQRQARFIPLNEEQRSRLRVSPVVDSRFWTDTAVGSPVAVELASRIYEVRARMDLRLLLAFEPMPPYLLVALAMDDWDALRWTLPRHVQQAQARYLGLNRRYGRL